MTLNITFRSQVASLLLIATLLGAPQARASGSAFELGSEARDLTTSDIRTAAAVLGAEAIAARAHDSLVASSALDERVKASVHASIDDILNARTVDVQLNFLTGFPDLASACLEGHINRNVAIEACANTLILLAGFSAAMNDRWDLFVRRTANGNVHPLAAGPGFGGRVDFESPVFMGPSDSPFQSAGIDVKASLEYVYWMAKHFGLTAQLDLGGILRITRDAEVSPMPMIKFSLGLAF
jgi:hypothetical protein